MNIKVMTRRPTLRCVCISVRPVMRWNATPLVSGRSQKVIAFSMGCLLLVVESVSVNWLLSVMYGLIWSQPTCWSLSDVVEFLLLLSHSSPRMYPSCSQNIWKTSHPDSAVCPRKFHWILYLWMLQELGIYLSVSSGKFWDNPQTDHDCTPFQFVSHKR
jgi:hypothetical protein